MCFSELGAQPATECLQLWLVNMRRKRRRVVGIHIQHSHHLACSAHHRHYDLRLCPASMIVRRVCCAFSFCCIRRGAGNVAWKRVYIVNTLGSGGARSSPTHAL